MHMHRLTIVVVASCGLVACVPPQQPGYYQGPPPRAQSGYVQAPPPGAPPPGTAPTEAPPPAPPPTASAAPASCTETLQCYGQCNPLTEPCIDGCDARTSPASAQTAHTLLQCMAQSGCQDQGCVAQRCGPQISACTAPGGAPPPEPVAAPAPPAPEPAPAAGAPSQPVTSVVPGRYACQTLTFGANSYPHFVPSMLGTIEIDARGRYHANVPRGEGATSLSGNLLAFVGGAYDGWVAFLGESSGGRYLRFSGTDPAHPAPSTVRGDHLCYLRR